MNGDELYAYCPSLYFLITSGPSLPYPGAQDDEICYLKEHSDYISNFLLQVVEEYNILWFPIKPIKKMKSLCVYFIRGLQMEMLAVNQFSIIISSHFLFLCGQSTTKYRCLAVDIHAFWNAPFVQTMISTCKTITWKCYYCSSLSSLELQI